MSDTKYYCICCGKELGYIPVFCCNAYDCGCRGLPVEPLICSYECYEKMEIKAQDSFNEFIKELEAKKNRDNIGQK